MSVFAWSEFRREKDDYFRTSRHSPLSAEQKASFQGLRYFPANEQWVFNVPLERYASPKKGFLATNTGEMQEYLNVGQVHFVVEGEEVILQVYQATQGDDYFIPFVDATAPKETYGAGRYLEPEVIGEGWLRLDFNQAYNPYCAYNDLWSCPIPPVENRVKIRIEAGEMKFHD